MERMIIAHNRVCREEGEKGIGGLDCDQVAAFHGFRHSTGFPRFFSPKSTPQILLPAGRAGPAGRTYLTLPVSLSVSSEQ